MQNKEVNVEEFSYILFRDTQSEAEEFASSFYSVKIIEPRPFGAFRYLIQAYIKNRPNP